MKKANHISTILFIAITAFFILTAAKHGNAEQLSNFTGKWTCAVRAEGIEDFGKHLTVVSIMRTGMANVSATFMQSIGERDLDIPRTHTTSSGRAFIKDEYHYLGLAYVLKYTDHTGQPQRTEWVFGCNGQIMDPMFGYRHMECIGIGLIDDQVTGEFRCNAQCKRLDQHID